MTLQLPKLVATSVVRGSEKGQSHGGVYLIDFAEQRVEQKIDWNTGDIDFSGRGWDRGLRGIEFTDDAIWICLLYTSPSPRDLSTSRMPSSA